ncbi:acetoacetate decarboxylase [Nocardioides scoriae]|uniref:Acetoacetate decarboxylase n=1 Tax=Nocardioides scoriae TaxID=642780 RepID=A0A1H1XWY0_9ACTN|nr:acetoacetate decarboxylase family protein [Nocardioides scoriae]SDT13645.1 acetoacetate decarboxylase [Nocardioides scoriae]
MTGDHAAYPASPWLLHGQLWLSLFGVRRGEDPARPDRPAGLYGVALVSYETPSPLVYGELLVARAAAGRAQVTEIWVDSPASRAGGRDLWAIPKELAELEQEHPPGATSWSVRTEASPVASARFTAPRVAGPRVPFGFRTQQLREDGTLVVTPVRGTARVAPVRATWGPPAGEVAHDPAPSWGDDRGPLAWLAGKRPLVSLRATDFVMRFGR